MEQQILEATEHFVSPEERIRLIHLCTKITGDRDAAEGLAQETLLEAWKHLNALRDQSRRAQWLNGVACNVCLRWMRRHQKDRAQLLDPPADQDASPSRLEDFLADDFDVEVELEHKELVELLDRALALLPAETRTILVKRYVEESPLQEVADQLGLNVSTAAMRLQRGKLALRRVLTTDLRQEIAPYSISSTLDQWEETPFMGGLYLLATLSLLVNPALKKM
jgi:RNA polymerase sigma factor (sigma-70 family)